MTEDPAVEPVPWALRAAATLATAIALGELTAVAGRTDLTVGLRVGLMFVVGLQLVFAARLSHYSAGSVLGLFVFQGMAVIAALGSNGPLVLRGALALGAIAVILLLGASLSAFPSPTPPRP